MLILSIEIDVNVHHVFSSHGEVVEVKPSAVRCVVRVESSMTLRAPPSPARLGADNVDLANQKRLALQRSTTS